MEQVGFVGLGEMGLPMTANLIRKGFALAVFDVQEPRMRQAEAMGAIPAASLKALSSSVDIVLTMLSGPSELTAMALGPDGILAHGRPNMTLVSMSTVDPATIDAVATACTMAGAHLVDAAVGRLVEHAERGECLFMIGAVEDDLSRVRPLLEAMGDRILHMGPIGAGVRTKLVIHFLAIVSCQMNAEAFALSQGMGLDLPRLFELMQDTTAVNGQMVRRYPSKVFRGDIEPGCTISQIQEELKLAIAAADQAGVPVPMAEAARTSIELACEAGYSSKDFSSLLDYWCARAGVPPCRFPARVL